MPARTYMAVDPRRDHSLRVPRPDLSVAIGTPNACTGCHKDRPARWAAEQVAAWRGAGHAPPPHFGVARDAGRRGLPGAEAALARLATDRAEPAIARATALALLPDYLTPASLAAVEAALADGDPLVRAAALLAMEGLPPDRRAERAAPLLGDSVRAVRIAAARALADVPRTALPETRRRSLDAALAELIRAEQVIAERPEAHVNLANLYARLGRPGDAESALRAALHLEPRLVQALVNLADLFRAQGRDADGERFLERALEVAPGHAEAMHALGLLRVRQGRRAEALELLRRAAAAQPESVRFAYVYAVGLHSAGRTPDAIAALERLHRRRPADREVLSALVSYHRQAGDRRAALRHAEALAALLPGDAQTEALVSALRREAGGS
jgi:tetratricopeptide (TPR) repeat protein